MKLRSIISDLLSLRDTLVKLLFKLLPLLFIDGDCVRLPRRNGFSVWGIAAVSMRWMVVRSNCALGIFWAFSEETTLSVE